MVIGIHRAIEHSLSPKVGTNFVNKRRPLTWYSSLTTQTTTFRSLYDENDDDSDTESANSTNSKSHSREPLTQELFSGSNSQPNNRSNGSEDVRIRNSMDSRGKADVNIYDDNSYC
jgi:hypothetical protein